MPLSLFEQHYQSLQYLDNATKIQIIEQLKKDVNQNEENTIKKLFGAWEDDRSADEMIAGIKGYSNDIELEKDIDEYSSLDYMAVSDDNTDKNWFSDLSAFIDENIKISDLPYSANHRGWTRDD